MVLEWLSRLLSGLSFQLGGVDTRSIWSRGRGSISENIFQDSQLFKFTPAFTHALNVENYNTKMGLLSDFSHAEQTVKLLDQQKQVDLSFIDSEIKTLKEITIPDPNYINYIDVIRSKSKRRSRTPAYSVINPFKFATYQSQVAEFASYKDDALSKIKNQIDFFTGKRDLISSKSFSL